MTDRVDVPALLRRSAARVEQPNWYMPDPEDAVFLDRLADAVEHMCCRYTEDEEKNRADATRAALALLRGDVAP